MSTEQNSWQKQNPVRKAAGTVMGVVQLALMIAMVSAHSQAQFETPVTLSLINGWKSQPFSTGRALIEKQNGIVQFRGAISATGTNLVPFTVPAAFRPATDVYVPVDLCNATKGRLHITPSGATDIEVEGGVTTNATCFTSLDGASFAATTAGFAPLTLTNGWTNAPFSTSNVEFKNINGIVHFKARWPGDLQAWLSRYRPGFVR